MKKSIVAVLLLAMTVAFPTAAFAQPYVSDFEETLSLADTTVEPGDDVPVEGSGYAADSQVVITIESTPRTLDRVRADSDGAISATVTIPVDMPAGQHTLKATGVTPDGAPHVLSTPITVGDAVGDTEELAFTGLNTAAAAVVAVILMALGGAALLVTRRRAA
jgi:hypothetical protein